MPDDDMVAFSEFDPEDLDLEETSRRMASATMEQEPNLVPGIKICKTLVFEKFLRKDQDEDRARWLTTVQTAFTRDQATNIKISGL